jgi:hypothetical protein
MEHTFLFSRWSKAIAYRESEERPAATAGAAGLIKRALFTANKK